MKRVKISILVGFIYFIPHLGFCQLLHEIGLSAGPVAVTTDYGEAGNFENFYSNVGFGIGLQHYINFAYLGNANQRNYFKNHFRVRNELSYFHANINHYGSIASQDDKYGEMLTAMHGEVQNFEFGVQLEWHINRIKEFLFFTNKFSPYVTAGANLVYFMPDAYSDLGSLDSPRVLFPGFEDALNLESGITYNFTFGGGTRYRLSKNSDLMAEAKWQYYASDYIEGFNVQGSQNKSNDWIIWLNIGYIYHLNF